MHDGFEYPCYLLYNVTAHSTVLPYNSCYSSHIHIHFCRHWPATLLLVFDRLPPLPKSTVPMFNSRTRHSRLIVDDFHHFKRFCRSKTEFSTKFYHNALFEVFLHFKLWHEHSTYADNGSRYNAAYEPIDLKFGTQ